MSRSKWIILAILIGLPAVMRVAGHPWNFAPVGALALFVGAHFRNRWLALLVPVLAMFLSDVAMGWERKDWSYTFHDLLPLIYACFLLYVCLGIGIRRFWNSLDDKGESTASRTYATKAAAVPVGALAGAVAFFLVTNFAVWAIFPTYPHTLAGLEQCFAAALPYFRYTLIGDLVFAVAFFGGYELLRGRLPALERSELLYVER